jgi:hypothetical protein
MRKLIIICFVLTWGLSMTNSQAQKSLSHYAETLTDLKGHDELKKQGLVQHMYTMTKFPQKYYVENPVKFKRVGILSLMVRQDASVSTDNNQKLTFSEGTLQAIATEIGKPIEKALKEAGKEKGIEILTPKEYLTSDELIEEYLSIKLEKGMLISGDNVQASLGYRPFNKLVTEGSSAGLGGVTYSSFYTIGKMAKKANLDAVIIVVVTTYSAVIQNIDRKLLFHRIAFSNFLVNQTPYMEDRKYPKLLGGYVSLLPAGYSRVIAAGSTIMDFDQVGKGEIVSTDFKPDFSGGLRSTVTSTPKLNLISDHTDDLGKLAANFVPFYLDTVDWFVKETNEKNKLK